MSPVMASKAKASAVIGKLTNGVPVAFEPQGNPVDDALRKADQNVRLAIQLASPVEGRFKEFIDQNRAMRPSTMVKPNSFAGQTLALCGAGPSLCDAKIVGVDQIFACNSAVNYLMAQGVNVTGAIGVDQTPGLLREWDTTYDIPYYVASSCDPQLIKYLRSKDRQLYWFHNAVGLEDEILYYSETWPPGFVVGEGFTVVSRFIGMALWMGFERIDVYGADCCLAEGDIAHANGEHVEDAYHNPLLMWGKLPPSEREWRTRPDMLRDAVSLAKRAQSSAGRIRLMGDTLPVALLGKDQNYLDQVSRTLLPGELPPTEPTI